MSPNAPLPFPPPPTFAFAVPTYHTPLSDYTMYMYRTTVVQFHPVTTCKAIPSPSHVSVSVQLYHSSCTRTPLSDQRHRRRHVSPRVRGSNSTATFQLLFVFRFYDDVLFYFPPRSFPSSSPSSPRVRVFFRRPSHPSREDYA